MSDTVLLALFAIIVIIVSGVAVLAYNFGNSTANQAAVNSLQNQFSTLQSQVKDQQGNLSSLQGKVASLPNMNRKPK